MANDFKKLPPRAFDGQRFIDAFRIEWVFDGSAQCWRKIGPVTDIPLGSEVQTGLLSAKLKQLLDSIPEKGGHFGIIAQPLLSLVSQNPNILKKDEVDQARKVESGTRIVGKSIDKRSINPEEFTGKILIFKTGDLTKKAYLVFTNDETSIYLDGDATRAKRGDKYEIVDSSELNPSGILLGDIMLVSDSIDITCVDGKGAPLTQGNCNIDTIQCDNVENPPGLNFALSQDLLESMCVIIPGCQGPKGNEGDKGEDGEDGTGDGPQGEQGDSGEDALAVANTFTGIKIIDVDDIHDTAIVSMELDADNGKLNIIRAKVRVPDNDTPATKLIATPISRSIKFTDDETFDYEIMKPTVDPIGESDVAILKYPDKYRVTNASGAADKTTVVNRIMLSDLIDSVLAFYENRLSEINDDYNQQLKEYIEAKDEAARTILAGLAMQVAECEFELPIDFCIGLRPDCSPGEEGLGFQNDTFVYPFANMFFGTGALGTAIDMGPITISGVTSDLETVDSKTFIKYPSQDSSSSVKTIGKGASQDDISSVTLPPGGYIIQWISGVLKSSATDYLVGSASPNVGLEAEVTDGANPTIIVKMPIPSAPFNDKEQSSVEFAYQEAPLTEKVMVVQLNSEGTIALRANLPGVSSHPSVNGSVTVRIIQVEL